ncbi:unnamed protein product [Protopolystoma xenopodis]|uniref:Uncharacterized protein n=1 Tax=Protopolystoma xenopodis TaxID=117903 RepID=A0A3S5FEF1_9PLAT|nr:unnamed protein product [Protopolystoma xenopodis]
MGLATVTSATGHSSNPLAGVNANILGLAHTAIGARVAEPVQLSGQSRHVKTHPSNRCTRGFSVRIKSILSIWIDASTWPARNPRLGFLSQRMRSSSGNQRQTCRLEKVGLVYMSEAKCEISVTRRSNSPNGWQDFYANDGRLM